jgi:hypothetical protein
LAALELGHAPVATKSAAVLLYARSVAVAQAAAAAAADIDVGGGFDSPAAHHERPQPPAHLDTRARYVLISRIESKLAPAFS